jgi:CO dehydrogenase maturation factor
MKIAISGKGGVGKTTIMALLANQFKKQGKEVLLIDADPSPHMAQTIGIKDIDKIKPIADMTELLVERSGKVQGSPFYQINPQVDDLLQKFMIEQDGIKLMVLGSIQTAEGGCACPENTVLKRMLTKLLLSPSQIVVIPSKSSVRTAQKIKKLAVDSGIPKISFIGNLVQDEEDKNFLREALGEPPAALFSDSSVIRKAERNGQPLIELTEQVTDAPEKLVAYLES